MRKAAYFFAFILTLFIVACSNDDDETSHKIVAKYVDISDFTMYQGTADGGVEVIFNNIKRKDLATLYFDTVYKPRLYSKMILQFNGDKLTLEEYTQDIATSSNLAGRKTISRYVFRNDSLFILKSDTTVNTIEKFVVLGSSPDLLYRTRSMVRYPLSADKDTIFSTDQHMNLEKVLKLAKYNSLEDMKRVGDTIAWCNMTYTFN